MNGPDLAAPAADDEQTPAGRALPDIASAKHINHTPFPSQYYQTVDQHGEAFHVVATRITYDMQRLWGNGYLSYAEHQSSLASSDVWDGIVNESSPLWESDFAPYKPKCDVLVAHAVSRPDKSLWNHISGAPAGSARRWPCSIALRWQDEAGQTRTWHKQLVATGPRTHGMLGAVSQPEPAQQTAIHWQNAYGGPLPQKDASKPPRIHERNPVGCGLDKSRGRAAPRLEVAGAELYNGQSDYPPVSLTALGKAWLPRRLLAGTYDQRWLDEQPHIRLLCIYALHPLKNANVTIQDQQTSDAWNFPACTFSAQRLDSQQCCLEGQFRWPLSSCPPRQPPPTTASFAKSALRAKVVTSACGPSVSSGKAAMCSAISSIRSGVAKPHRWPWRAATAMPCCA